MSWSYKKLWHHLIELNIKPTELKQRASLTANAWTQLKRDERISSKTLERICDELNCNLDDIVEYSPDKDK